ncbi:MAG: DUF4296 domain-containing protein [Prevotellaceae bacterium]|jgi:hypothetical protein|nr:DUF4296 domain-containing protein [Prevotellaceae bacterium]
MKSKIYILSLLLLAFIAAGCGRLPEKKTIALLTDFYLYQSLPGELPAPVRDSVSLALSLLEKHRVSQEQFDATMQYYAAHPRKMKVLYEKIKQEMQERIDGYGNIIETQELAQNRWRGASQIAIDSVQLPRTKSFFLPVKAPGNYTLKAVVTLFDNDSTQQPEMVGYFLAGIDSLPRDTVNRKTVLFARINNPQPYTLSFSVQDTAIYAFEGYWLQVKRDTVPVRQHITMEKLRILYHNDSTKTIASGLKTAAERVPAKKNPAEPPRN